MWTLFTFLVNARFNFMKFVTPTEYNIIPMILGSFLTIGVTFIATLTPYNKNRQKVYNYLQRQQDALKILTILQ